MIRIIWNRELYHSWGKKPQQKRREKQYNAEYYRKYKWRWYDDIKNGARNAIDMYGYMNNSDKDNSKLFYDIKRGAEKAVNTVKDLYSKDDGSKYKKEIEANLRNAQMKREQEARKLEALERKRDIQQAKEEAERKAEEAAERERLRKLAEQEKQKNSSGKKKSSGGKSKNKGGSKSTSNNKKVQNNKTSKPTDKRGGRNPHKKGRIDTIIVSRKMSTIPDIKKANIVSQEILRMKIGG